MKKLLKQIKLETLLSSALYIVLGIVYPCLRKLKNIHWAAVLIGLAALNLACGEVVRDSAGMIPKLV